MDAKTVEAAAFSSAVAALYVKFEDQRQAIGSVNGGELPTRDQVAQWVIDLTQTKHIAQVGQRKQVESFLQFVLQPQYMASMVAAGGTWAVLHATAIASLIKDAAGDFARTFAEADRRSQVTVREVRRAVATKDLTAFGDALTGNRVDRVIYGNGASVPVDAWAEMEAKTKLAVAWNAAVLNSTVQQGGTHVEVSDGSSCGWTYHDDPDRADGSIRTVEEAAAYPISHPNCQRAFSGRYDITPETAGDATGSSDGSTPDLPQAAWDGTGSGEPRPAEVARDALMARRAERFTSGQ